MRRRLVSAILLGGNVLVGNGSAKDGDFQHVPPCTSKDQTAASSPTRRGTSRRRANASFEHAPSRAQHVLCVNPAAPRRRAGRRSTPLFLTSSFNEMGGVSPQLLFAINTDWVSYPDLYKAQCMRRGSDGVAPGHEAVTRNDKRPTAHAMYGAHWGLHPLDVNIALFELVGLVGSQATAYLTHR